MLDRGIAGHNMAKAAIEMGCWALSAQRLGVSLATLLGGTRDRVATGISIGIQTSPEALVERARRAVADGYRKIKVKIQPGADVKYVSAVRESLGHGVGIMADANSAYTIDAADHLRELDAFNLIIVVPEWTMEEDGMVRGPRELPGLGIVVDVDRIDTQTARRESIEHLGSRS